MALVNDPLDPLFLSDPYAPKKKSTTKKLAVILAIVLVVLILVISYFVFLRKEGQDMGGMMYRVARLGRQRDQKKETTKSTPPSDGVTVEVGESVSWPDQAFILLRIEASGTSAKEAQKAAEQKLTALKDVLAKFGVRQECLQVRQALKLNKTKRPRVATQEMSLELQFPEHGALLPDILHAMTGLVGITLLSIQQEVSERQKAAMVSEAEHNALEALQHRLGFSKDSAITTPPTNKMLAGSKLSAVKIMEPPVVASNWVAAPSSKELRLFKVQIPMIVRSETKKMRQKNKVSEK